MMVPDLVLLGLIVLFVVLTVYDTYRGWSIEQKSRVVFHNRRTNVIKGEEDGDEDPQISGKQSKPPTKKTYTSKTGLYVVILNVLICLGMIVSVGLWFASAIAVIRANELRSR